MSCGIRYFSDFVVDFDSRTRNPKWVLEHLTTSSVNGTAERAGSDFFEDKGLEPRFRSRLADYRCALMLSVESYLAIIRLTTLLVPLLHSYSLSSG
jgi:DNA/RNA non-specific endonuclease